MLDSLEGSADGFFCDMSAMTTEDRARHSALVARLSSAPHALQELEKGYELSYPDARATFGEAAEWAALETRCCPFLDLSLRLSPDRGPLVIRLTGPVGVKEFLKDELGPLVT